MALNDRYHLTFGYTVGNEWCQGRMYYLESTPCNAQWPSKLLASRWAVSLGPQLQIIWANSAVLHWVRATKQTGTNRAPFTYVTRIAGVTGVQCLPPHCTMRFYGIPFFNTPSRRSRLYLSGAPEETQSNGAFEAGQFGQMQTFADQLVEEVLVEPPETGGWKAAWRSVPPAITVELAEMHAQHVVGIMRTRRVRPQRGN